MIDARPIVIGIVDQARGSLSEKRTGRHSWRSFGGGGLMIACTGALCFGFGQFVGAVQKGENVVRADKVISGNFELTGSNGKPAASLMLNDRGRAMLSFFDDNGSSRLEVGLSPSGQPGLTLYDTKRGKTISLFMDDQQGTPHLELTDGKSRGTRIDLSTKEEGAGLSISKGGRIRLSTSLSDRGEPKIGLWGTREQKRISLWVDGDDPNISLLGQNNVVRANLTVLPTGTSAMYLTNRLGKARFKAAVTDEGPNGFASITLADHLEKDKITMMISEQGPLIILEEEGGAARRVR